MHSHSTLPCCTQYFKSKLRKFSNVSVLLKIFCWVTMEIPHEMNNVVTDSNPPADTGAPCICRHKHAASLAPTFLHSRRSAPRPSPKASSFLWRQLFPSRLHENVRCSALPTRGKAPGLIPTCPAKRKAIEQLLKFLCVFSAYHKTACVIARSSFVCRTHVDDFYLICICSHMRGQRFLCLLQKASRAPPVLRVATQRQRAP